MDAEDIKKICKKCTGYIPQLLDLDDSYFLCLHCGAKVGKRDKVKLTRYGDHVINCPKTRHEWPCICDIIEDSERFWHYGRYYGSGK